MPKFHYTAFDSSGRQIVGQIEAETADAAVRSLNQQGHYPIDVSERGARTVAPAANALTGLFSRGPTAAQITLFTQELGLLLAAGQPLVRALSLIEGDANAPPIQALASRLRTSISGGKSL